MISFQAEIISYKGKENRLTSDFLSVILEARWHLNNIHRLVREKTVKK